MRRTHFEPGGVPEYRSELLNHFFTITHFARSCNKHISTMLKNFQGFRIQGVGSVYFSFGYCHLSGINPEIPVIYSFCSWVMRISRFSFLASWISVSGNSRLPVWFKFPIGMSCVANVPCAYTLPYSSFNVYTISACFNASAPKWDRLVVGT